MTLSRFPLHVVHVELTTKCALKCPRCPRTEMKGMYNVDDMSYEFVKHIFDQIKDQINSINICGGQGDAIYNKDFLKIIKYFKSLKENFRVRLVTNGSYKSREWWNELGSMFTESDTIVFSVDGWDNDSNNQYRVGSDFESILVGIDEMVKSPAMVRWATIAFKFNQNKLKDIEKLAQSLGVDFFDMTKSGAFGSKFKGYNDPELGYDPLEPDDDALVTTYGSRFARYSVSFRGGSLVPYIREDKWSAWYEEQSKQYEESHIMPICKVGGVSYIDVDGIFYPCSWVSHPFKKKRGLYSGRITYWDDSFWRKNRPNLDLKIHTFEEIMNHELWDFLETSWSEPNACLLTCENKSICEIVRKDNILKEKM